MLVPIGFKVAAISRWGPLAGYLYPIICHNTPNIGSAPANALNHKRRTHNSQVLEKTRTV